MFDIAGAAAGARRRIEIIDALRGIAILLMVFYHFGYDMVASGYFAREVLFNPVLDFLQPFFAGVFILISGISCRFSRSNVKRGAFLLGLGLVLTAVTWASEQWFGMQDTIIRFGILHFLGVCAILYGLLRPLLDKIPKKVQPYLYGVLAVAGIAAFPINTNVPYLWALGFVNPGFFSSDYFPLLEWLFLFLFGTWFGQLISERRLPEWFYSFHVPFFPAVGRRALLIYLLHQPVIMGVLLLAGQISKG